MKAVHRVLAILLVVGTVLTLSFYQVRAVSNPYPYRLMVSPSYSTYYFRAENVGYTRAYRRSFGIHNMGSLDSGQLTVRIAGSDADAFHIYERNDYNSSNPMKELTIGNLESRETGGSSTNRRVLAVRPALGLSVGVYRAELLVEGANYEKQIRKLEFRVLKAGQTLQDVELTENGEKELSQENQDAGSGVLRVRGLPLGGLLQNAGLLRAGASTGSGSGDAYQLEFGVINTGNTDSGPLTLKLIQGKPAFSLESKDGSVKAQTDNDGNQVLFIPNMNVEKDLDYVVRPVDGLAAGYYTAEVVLSGDYIQTKSFQISHDIEEKAFIRTSSGSSSKSSETRSLITPKHTAVDAARMRSLIATADSNGWDFVRLSGALPMTVNADAWRLLADREFVARTAIDRVVQVQLNFQDPAKLNVDLPVSGWITGPDVEHRAAFFEKWYTNRLRVVHLDHEGEFSQSVDVAAKVDLTGFTTEDLALYRYDRASNTIKRLADSKPWIDKNGYLHFGVETGGVIVVSEGNLMKRQHETEIGGDGR